MGNGFRTKIPSDATPYRLVKKRNWTGDVFVQRQSGYKSSYLTDVAAIQAAIDECNALSPNSPPNIKLCGHFSIDDLITVNSMLDIDGQMSILEQDGAYDGPLMRNANYGAGSDFHCFSLRNLVLYGDRVHAARSTGSNLDFHAETIPGATLFSKNWINIFNVWSWEAYDNNGFFRFDGRDDLMGNMLYFGGTRAGDYGWYWRGCSDWDISHGYHLGGQMRGVNEQGVRFYGCGQVDLDTLYCTSGIQWYYGSLFKIANLHVDHTCNAANEHAVWIRGLNYSHFTNLDVRILAGSVNNTYDAVLMQVAGATNPTDNQFVNTILRAEGAPLFRNGINDGGVGANTKVMTGNGFAVSTATAMLALTAAGSVSQWVT